LHSYQLSSVAIEVPSFIHSSDLQIGMPFKFLKRDSAIEMMKADRLDSLNSIGKEAKSRGAEFVLIAGDLFDSSLTSRPLVEKVCQSISRFPCDVYVLAGNHEWKDSNSNILESDLFLKQAPGNLKVLQPGINPISDDTEIFAVPVTGTHNQQEIIDSGLSQIPKSKNKFRILAMHGQLDSIMPLSQAKIRIETIKELLDSGQVDYVALGDRHSTTNCLYPDLMQDVMTDRVFYSGAPEPTDFNEQHQGNILSVTINAENCVVELLPIGRWNFESIGSANSPFKLENDTNLSHLFEKWKANGGDRKIVKLYFESYLEVSKLIELQTILEELDETYFARFYQADSNPANRVPAEVDESDKNPLGLNGFVLETYNALHESARRGDEVAMEALSIIHRTALEL